MENEYRWTHKGHVLIISRIFNGSAERLFRAWTSPEELMKWWGPYGFTSPVCKVDLRVGGEYHYCSRSPEGVDFWSRGIFREIVRPRKLVVADSFSDESGRIIAPSAVGLPPDWPTTLLITITFEGRDRQTIFTLRHERLPFGLLQNCRAGWNESLDKLQALIDE